MVNKKARLLLEELEEQFHGVQQKIMKSRDSYLANHKKDYEKAKAGYQRNSLITLE